MQLVTTATSRNDTLYPPMQRQNLTDYLAWIWQNYFFDIPYVNAVLISYGYPWKSRLGLIRLSVDKMTTFIGINILLQLEQVPEYVLVTTVAHELVHYAHGFGSPLPRRFRHPHANRVVDKELERRELGAQLYCCNEWIDKYWYPFYDMQRETGWTSIPSVRSTTQRDRK